MDIVERLARDAHILHAASPHGFSSEGQAMTMARDEITRLREALVAIQNAPNHAKLDWYELVEWMCGAARAALHQGRQDAEKD